MKQILPKKRIVSSAAAESTDPASELSAMCRTWDACPSSSLIFAIEGYFHKQKWIQTRAKTKSPSRMGPIEGRRLASQDQYRSKELRNCDLSKAMFIAKQNSSVISTYIALEPCHNFRCAPRMQFCRQDDLTFHIMHIFE